ncbi:sporulation protein YunB [Fictibacillus aquaticus]|uniref:Sporulation protein YunB n=1 Tax=Fictibacillus aquaticus TaxID=2021314 RepID=A0A235F5Q6_9BACL|nr:sporulation protein YunB [Fictibacillus aquaticus]OYD56035.1 sporulation protein YunB [Fictibacillus aquaticus]
MLRRRRKFRLRKGPLPIRYVLSLSMIIFMLMTVQGLWIVNRGIEPTLIHIAETKTDEIASQAINEAVMNKIVETGDMDNVVKYVENSKGEVISASIDQKVVNRIMSQAAYIVQAYLKDIEEGRISDLGMMEDDDGAMHEYKKHPGLVAYIPLGQATNNALLANLGPKIPVKYTAIGDVDTDVQETFEEKGINNIKHNVNIIVKVKVKIVIPFATKTAIVERPIPIASYILPGEVPQYYNDSDSGSGSIQPSVPLDPNKKKTDKSKD